MSGLPISFSSLSIARGALLGLAAAGLGSVALFSDSSPGVAAHAPTGGVTSRTFQLVLRHEDVGDTTPVLRLSGPMVGLAPNGPRVLHLEQRPCPGRYRIQLEISRSPDAHTGKRSGAHPGERHGLRITYIALLRKLKVNGVAGSCRDDKQPVEGAPPGGAPEPEPEAHRRLFLELHRRWPFADNPASFASRRDPESGDFRGELRMSGLPCPGFFEFEIHSQWADGTNRNALVYSFSLRSPRVNYHPARCLEGQRFLALQPAPRQP